MQVVHGSGWPWMIAIAFTCGPVHPGLSSWDILSRPWRDLSRWITLPRTTPDFLYAALDTSA
jgi:hypothetical protein